MEYIDVDTYVNNSMRSRITITEGVISWLFKVPIDSEIGHDMNDDVTERHIVGYITLIFALLNLMVAFPVTVTLFRADSMRTSFGYLNISHGVADCLVLFMFIVWYAPMIITGSNVAHTVLGISMMQITGELMCGSVHSAIAIAIGRYVALVHPLDYAISFNKRRTMLYIALVWISASTHHIPAIIPQCNFYFDLRYYTWIYADTPCGQFLSWFTDLCYGFLMIVLVGIPNLATFIQLRKIAKKQMGLGVTLNKRSNREWRFFVQAFTSNIIIMIIFLSFHVVNKTRSQRFIHFLTSCLCVILVHGTNSIVLLIGSRDLRKRLMPWCKKEVSKQGSSTGSSVLRNTSSVAKSSDV